MKESGYDEKIIKAIKRGLPGCEVLRHEDKFQKNYPDIQILHLDRASFFEVKVISPGDTLKKKCKMGQCVFGDKLARVTGGRAWILIFDEKRGRTELWRPAALAAHLWPDLCGLMALPRDREPWLVSEGLNPDLAVSAIKKMYARVA